MWGSNFIGSFASKAGRGLLAGTEFGVGLGARSWRAAGGLGLTGRAAAFGAGVGGLYGALSNDTSVLGGMAGGALMGMGARYGAAAYRGARLGGRMTGPRMAGILGLPGGSLAQGLGGGAYRGMRQAFRRDLSGIRHATSLVSNTPMMRVPTVGRPSDWLKG